MCYNIEALKKSQEKKAQHLSNFKGLDLGLIQDNHLVSGFDHPSLLLVNKYQQGLIGSWGLVPSFYKDQILANEIRNKTLNCRVETMFDKPSFKDYSEDQRCVFYLDAFYDYHHIGGKKVACRIRRSDGELISVGGVYSLGCPSLENKVSFSMLTEGAKGIMEVLHNRTKEPRMPLVLNEKEEEEFLNLEKEELKSFLLKRKEVELEVIPVAPLSGSKSRGNVASQKEWFDYGEVDLRHLGINGNQLKFF